jgi:excisionase family DNA binding protein
METTYSPSLANSAGLPLPPSLAKLAALLYELVDERVESSLRVKQAALQSEQENADAEAQRNEQRIDKYAVAERLGVTTQTVWEYYRKDLLPGVKVGNRILFRRGDVEALLQVQTKPDGRRKYARRPGNQKGR